VIRHRDVVRREDDVNGRVKGDAQMVFLNEGSKVDMKIRGDNLVADEGSGRHIMLAVQDLVA